MAQLPDWQPLEGGAVPVSEGAGAGRVVAVVASEGAAGGGWAGAATLEFARTWSGRGEKVILVDGALHSPTLHADVALDNVEGLSDATLFGVSVGRVAHPVDDGAFFLITAGTAVADANTVASSPRWSRFLEGFSEAGVTLILFVRDGDRGCAAFLGCASDIIVLADQGEGAPAAVRDLEGLVRAVTGPRRPWATADEPVRAPSERTEATPGRGRWLWLVILVVVVAVVLLAVFDIISIPGFPGEASGTG